MIGAIVAGGLSAMTPPVTNSYESIETFTVGAGGSPLLSFTSIPSTYKHLQIRAFAKGSVNSEVGCAATFNGDSSTNYVQFHQLYGQGTSAIAGVGGLSSVNMEWFYMPGTNRAASTFGGYVLDILDYQNTNKNKTVRHLGGFDDNGAGFIILRSHLWMNTAAINRIDIAPNSGNFTQYSSFALYGIKG
jgi:hypothetical protein